ncbi:hypothetical protein [Amycolatopsis magusensis]|uniref:Secreted protein n=1 Tax=Amycolatopsis magusensis TaxID=882444 RepID=A0ABS4PR15_9PSEU|nr:hypothetical protein [Amycolatopsis magusensis]MBP2181874.1 hypothetical protein [Amycolatopsis magusensis]
MRKTCSMAAVLAAFTTLMVTAPASAASGRVMVFETEFTELTVYQDPTGCHKLPAAAHVLVNDTDGTVRIYGDPLCLTPSLEVAPNHGSHVAPGSGSFSA